jgi:hypothetical protein
METCGWPFGARHVTKGVFWVIIFIKKLFLLHIILHLCFFMSLFGERLSSKKTKKTTLLWILDPKEKSSEKQDAS